MLAIGPLATSNASNSAKELLRFSASSIATTNRYIEIDLAMKRKALATCEVTASDPSTATWCSNPDILSWLDSL
jgi:hypothetical protein